MTTPSLDPAPRLALEELVAAHGTELARQPERVGGLLRELAGDHRHEISLLVAAAEEGVAAELCEPAEDGFSVDRLSGMIRRLQDHRGLSQADALWALGAWADAVAGHAPQDAPATAPPPEVPAAPRAVATAPTAPAAVQPAARPQMWPPPWDLAPEKRRFPPVAIAVAVIAVVALVAGGFLLLTRGSDVAGGTEGAGSETADGGGDAAATPPPVAVNRRGATSSASASTVTLSWQPPDAAQPDGYVVSRDGTEITTTADLSITDEDVQWGSAPTYEIRATYGTTVSAPVSVSVQVPDPQPNDAQLDGNMRTVATLSGGDNPTEGELGYQQSSMWSFTPSCADPSCPVQLRDTHFGWHTTLKQHGHAFEGSVTGRFQSVCGRSTPTLSNLQITIEPTGAGAVDGVWAVTSFTGTVHETFVDCSGSFDYTIAGA
jgi:hypothetical protein